MSTVNQQINELAMAALRPVFMWRPWGADKASRAVARFLDGNETALDKLPTIKQQFLDAERAGFLAELLDHFQKVTSDVPASA